MVGTATAGWQEKFKTTEFTVDLDTAVLRALVMNVDVRDIVSYALLDLHMSEVDIFVSLYCAGKKSPELVKVSQLFFVPISKVIEAYRISTTKCKLGVAEGSLRCQATLVATK